LAIRSLRNTRKESNGASRLDVDETTVDDDPGSTAYPRHSLATDRPNRMTTRFR
jgi:hypothetical protein